MDEHLKKIQSDIDNMNKTFSGQAPDPTEPPPTDPPGTLAPGTNVPVTAIPVTEVGTTAVPTTEVPEDKDKTIEELRAKLAEKEAKVTKAPKTKVPTTEVPMSFDEQDFLGDLDLDDLTRDKSLLNKAFNKLYQKAVGDTRKVLGEGILRSIPDIVKTNIVMINNLQKASEGFYKENEDLKPFKKVVAAVFEELNAEHPEKKYDEIMKDVGPEVRKRLELHKVAKKPPDKKNPPRLPNKGKNQQRSNAQPSTDPLLADIEEMNKILGR